MGAFLKKPEKVLAAEAEARAAAAAADGVSEADPHCYICLQPEAEEQDALRNVEGLLLCASCYPAGTVERYSKDAASRPAVTAGSHPKFGCLGCLPGTRPKKRKSGKSKSRFSTPKKASKNKKLEVSRDKAATAAAALVAAALAQRC